MAHTNGTGQGGKSMQDRELAARVRSLTLEEIKTVLATNGSSDLADEIRKELGGKRKKDYKLYAGVVTKLAGSVLPRLNEHSGPDGKDLPTPILHVSSNNGAEEDPTS